MPALVLLIEPWPKCRNTSSSLPVICFRVRWATTFSTTADDGSGLSKLTVEFLPPSVGPAPHSQGHRHCFRSFSSATCTLSRLDWYSFDGIVPTGWVIRDGSLEKWSVSSNRNIPLNKLSRVLFMLKMGRLIGMDRISNRNRK